MSNIQRQEPADLTNQKWLETGNYFSAENLADVLDTTYHLELEYITTLNFDGTNDYGLSTSNIGGVESFEFKMEGAFSIEKHTGDYFFTEITVTSTSILYRTRNNTGNYRYWSLSFSKALAGLNTIKVNVVDLSVSVNGVSEGTMTSTNSAGSNCDWNTISNSASIGRTFVNGSYGYREGKLCYLKAYNSSEALIGNWTVTSTSSSILEDTEGTNDISITGASLVGGFFSSGYRVSNPLSLNSITDVGSSNIKWTSTEPTSTDIKIYTAVSDSDTENPEIEENYYSKGIEYISWVTGYSLNSGIQSKESDHLYLEAWREDTGIGAGARTYVTGLKIDLTNINTLYVEWENIGDGSNYVAQNNKSWLRITSNSDGYSDTVGSLEKTGTFTKTVDSLDVSSFSGEYFISVQAQSFWSDTVAKIKVYNVYSDKLLYQEATNDASIPGITEGQDLTGKYLWVKQELSTIDTSETPRLSSLEVTVESSGYEIVLLKGEYTLTGQASSLLKTSYIETGTGNYALTGINASFKRSLRAVLEAGEYILTGINANIYKSYIFTCAVGAYTLTGIDVLLKRSFKIIADLGSYTLTGIDTLFKRTLKFITDTGNYILTGTEALFYSGYMMVCAVGNYTLTGIDATLRGAFRLVAEAGNYTLTGIDALFKRAYQLVCSVGTYTLTGIDAIIEKLYLLICSAGSFTLTGISATLTKLYTIVASAGSFVLSTTKVLWWKSWTKTTKPDSTTWTKTTKPDDTTWKDVR